MSLSDDVLVETVNKDITQNAHENLDEEEDDDEPPPLRKRDNDNESSVDSSGSDINWNLEDLIPEFRQTYRDEPGIQSKLEQEIWIEVHLKREGHVLATFHEIFPLRA